MPGGKEKGAWGVGPPEWCPAAPGECQFGVEWTSVRVVAKDWVTSDTLLFTFALPDQTKPLGLSTCACVLVKASKQSTEVRPYTPVSTNAMVGRFQLLAKLYDGGAMSKAFRHVRVGGRVCFSHLAKNVKIQYPFSSRARVVCLACGTGITPIFQALHALLGNDQDTTQVRLVYGVPSLARAFGRDILDAWATGVSHRDQFSLTYAVSDDDTSVSAALDEGGKSNVVVRHGRIDKDLLVAMMDRGDLPPPDTNPLILVCGTAGLYDSLCGPRADPQLSGALRDLGYRAEDVYKF